MKQLGYYAKDIKGNLYQFEWGDDNLFYIIDLKGKRLDDPKQYELLEIGYFTADSKVTPETLKVTDEQAKEIHEKIREIQRSYNNPEWGDCIIDEICFVFGYPTTTDVEEEYMTPKEKLKRELERDIKEFERKCKNLNINSMEYAYWNGCRCQAEVTLEKLNR